jgi:heat shock protein HslJ
MKNKTSLLALVVLLFSLIACTPAGGEIGEEPTTPPMETPVEQPTDSPVEQPTETPDEITIPKELLGTWYWLAFEDAADGADSKEITVSDPSKYRLEFTVDGMAQIQADCNSASSSVTVEGSGLTFAPGPMTLAECEPGSLYSAYLAKLGDVASYVFDADDNLVLNLKMDAGNMVFGAEPTPPFPSDLVDQIWYWLAFEDSADGAESNDIIVDEPSKYSIEFLRDGTYHMLADCNTGIGSYTAEANGLVLQPGLSTQAACEPGSLHDTFVARLSDVVSYVFDDAGNLVLNLKMDAGNMVFGPEASSMTALDGTSWRLVGQGAADDLTGPLPETEITLDFNEGQVAGSAGCNRYFANYTVTAAGNLQIGPAGSTMMACPEEIMQQEGDFLAALGAAESFTLNGETLTIHFGEGDLVFEEAQDLTLEGQVWTLSGVALNEAIVSTTLDSEITGEFSDGQVTGSAGCNSYFASYETVGSTLSLGPIGSTRMACDDETNQRETEFLTAFGSAAGYDISRNTLTLTDAEGNALLIFQGEGTAEE